MKRLLVLVAFCTLCTINSFANYSAIDLGTLGGPASLAERINERGDVVGGALTVAFEEHACLWKNEAAIDLGTLGGTESHAFNLNDIGHVVGYSRIPSGQIRAFLWFRDAMQNLGTLGGNRSYAFGVNNRREVVGASRFQIGNPAFHAFIWRNGEFTDIGTLGGPNSFAYSINNQGWVVGSSDTAFGETHSFLWRDGMMIDLGTLGGPFSESWDINSRGQYVMYDGDPFNGGTVARLTSGTVEVLSPLTGAIGASAVSINGRGVIGGFSAFDGGQVLPVLWEETTAVELPTLGIPYGLVNDVSENGKAVGMSVNLAFEDHATLWVKSGN